MEHMRISIEQMRQEMRYESRKFTLQLVSSFAAAIGASVALGVWLSHLAHLG